MFWLLPLLLLFLLLISLFAFYMAILRHKELSCHLLDYAEKTALCPEKYRERIREGMDWIRSRQPEDVWIKSPDGIDLHGYYLPADPAKCKGVFLAFHGYRSCSFFDFSCGAPYYHSLGYDLLLIDQRAAQKSKARFIGFGVLESQDAKLWAEYAKDRFGSSCPLILGGISMGASTVLYASVLGLPESVKAILADCGFNAPADIIASVMKSRYHLPRFPVLPLLDLACRIFARYSIYHPRVEEAMKKNTIPVIFIHGKDDKYVPYTMTEANYRACKAPKELLLIEDAGHGLSFFANETAYKRTVEAFFAKHIH